ncbi:DNA polymerase III subunit beta [Maritalea porphyrae]|uniref:DNA polymerase III subunit beta n=1 Tax=Maritalea porphyrae TaxID=880732 RepID=UPI0022B002DC|nr:DNA polymerase III subunit beta [Maritalea porphyrae]MCZ4270745.1 DNA polymerase III subunit beta [Maritalea porphyrae]
MNTATQIQTIENVQIAQNVTFERTSALAAMKAAILASDARSTVPILGSAKLEFANGIGTITCHNLDVEIEAQFATECDNSGAAVINAKDFEKLLTKLKSDQFSLEIGDNATLGDGKRSYTLPMEDLDQFPSLRRIDAQSTLVMPAQTLFQAIQRVKGAISTDETRYYLNGVYMHHEDGFLKFAATDGHRLYVQQYAQNAQDMPGVIISSDTIKMLEKILKGQTCPISIDVSENRLVVRVGDVTIRSKLVEGTFPDYHRVKPNFDYSKPEAELEIEQAEFLQAIKDVTILATGKSGKAIVVENTEDGLSLKTIINGSISTTNINAQGDLPYKCGYNSTYLADLLTVCGAGSITYRAEDERSPCLITAEGAEGWQGVVMPIQV